MSPEARRIWKWWCRQYPDAEQQDSDGRGERNPDAAREFQNAADCDSTSNEWFHDVSVEQSETTSTPSRVDAHSHRRAVIHTDILSDSLSDRTEDVMESITQEDVESLPVLERPFKDLIEFRVAGGNGGWHSRGKYRFACDEESGGPLGQRNCFASFL